MRGNFWHPVHMGLLRGGDAKEAEGGVTWLSCLASCALYMGITVGSSRAVQTLGIGWLERGGTRPMSTRLHEARVGSEGSESFVLAVLSRAQIACGCARFAISRNCPELEVQVGANSAPCTALSGRLL